jgi:hypothetical protein
MPTNPNRDAATETIALYLQEQINLRYQGSVAQISTVDRVPSDPAAYPHLVVHRTEAVGRRLELCRGIVRYLILSQTDRENLPGQFRTMQLLICELLEKFYDPELRTQIQLNEPDPFKSRDRILGFENGLVPFFEIEFAFLDFNGLQQYTGSFLG